MFVSPFLFISCWFIFLFIVFLSYFLSLFLHKFIYHHCSHRFRNHCCATLRASGQQQPPSPPRLCNSIRLPKLPPLSLLLSPLLRCLHYNNNCCRNWIGNQHRPDAVVFFVIIVLQMSIWQSQAVVDLALGR